MFGWRIKNLIILICIFLIFLFFSGCKGQNLKVFLYEHQEVRLQINSVGEIYDWHTSCDELDKKFQYFKDVLTIYVGETKQEILCLGKPASWIRITGTDYYLLYGNMYIKFLVEKDPPPKTLEELISSGNIVLRSKSEVKIINKEKEKGNMGLSLGTWLLLIALMIIVSKISSKLKLRTIFKPSKKAASHIKNEWKES